MRLIQRLRNFTSCVTLIFALDGCTLLSSATLLVKNSSVTEMSPDEIKAIIRDIDQIPDEELMVKYGSGLRSAFKTDDYELVSSPVFLKIETELEDRGLITRQSASEIERGIVYVGMPLTQALASVSGLKEVDTLVLNGHVIRSFRGATSAALGLQVSSDTFISCDGKIVTLFAAKGLITADTYHRTYGSRGIRFQTNFPPGFWKNANFENRIRGNRVFDKPRHFADRSEHRWSIFSNNSGVFVKPSLWRETGSTSYRGLSARPNINDLMNSHIRRGGPVC